MHNFVLFLGRFHVLALHLPIGIVVVAVALDFLVRWPRYSRLAPASGFLWGAAAITAVVTVGLGYMHFAEGAFAGSAASAHRFFGTSVAVVTVAIWWLSQRTHIYRRVNVATGLLALGLISVTGHFGGDLTHGPTYLWDYAPGPLRSLVGAAQRRPPVTSVASADAYFDVVQPLLQKRCGGCHNRDKLTSGFSVATYESTLKGGESGRVIAPGNSSSSELYRRISLPHDHEEFMPAEGKTPLTDAQVEIVRWWIDAGAPNSKTVADTSVDPRVEALLATELGFGISPSDHPSAPVVPASIDPALIQSLFGKGFIVRQASQNDPHLVVSVSSPGSPISAAQVAALFDVADRVVELNVQDASIDDATLGDIAKFAELIRLRVSQNELTDRSINALSSLTKLERLNLYGNRRVTDNSVDALARIGSLKRVDIWQTGITSEGLARLRKLRPDLDIQGTTIQQVSRQ